MTNYGPRFYAKRRRTEDKTENTAPAKQLVDVFLSGLGFDPQRYAVFDVCDQEIGKFVRGCTAVAMKGKRIYLQVPSAMHRQEIIYSRKRIIDRLNQVFGTDAVSELHFVLES